ncbi:MAG TPA: sulfurtransferase [Vicinamibacterales bacterium]|nr:sulfurtransferase [Vicinamibacterales bacterium]
MPYKTIITTDALAAHLSDRHFVLVDCRFKLDDVGWGEQQWRVGHIPGAVYAHLDRDLSGPKTGTNGRHPLPDPDVFARTLGRFGIGDHQVVAYDQDTGMFASRLWWLLRWMGHDAVAVLDGGFARWVEEGRVVSESDSSRPAAEFHGSARSDMTVTADTVATVSARSDWRVLDARAPERYRGEVEPMDLVAGHIPGAASYFFQRNLNDRGGFRTPEDLRERLRAVTGDVSPDHIVSYCGSGVQASHNLLALEHAGIQGAKLYPGSWSEWVSDPSRPVATGSEKPDA